MRYLEEGNSQRQKGECWLSGASGGAGRGVRHGRLLFNEYIVSVSNDEKFLKTDNGDGYTTLWICLMPQSYTLKNRDSVLPLQEAWVQFLVTELRF